MHVAVARKLGWIEIEFFGRGLFDREDQGQLGATLSYHSSYLVPHAVRRSSASTSTAAPSTPQLQHKTADRREQITIDGSQIEAAARPATRA